MLAADDEVIGQAALKQHVLSLRNHVKGLAGKDYKRLEGLHSLDFVLVVRADRGGVFRRAAG